MCLINFAQKMSIGAKQSRFSVLPDDVDEPISKKSSGDKAKKKKPTRDQKGNNNKGGGDAATKKKGSTSKGKVIIS